MPSGIIYDMDWHYVVPIVLIVLLGIFVIYGLYRG